MVTRIDINTIKLDGGTIMKKYLSIMLLLVLSFTLPVAVHAHCCGYLKSY